MNSYEDFSYDKVLNTITYVVNPGDTLYKIANIYKTSVSDIMQLNKLTSTLIFPNQVLFIPSDGNVVPINDNEMKYFTKEGDTLKSIAKMYSLDFSCLKQYQDILELKLEAGQLIIIELRQHRGYIVKDNDTIKSILQTNDLSPIDLIELNKSDWIKPGKKITIE